MGAEVGLGLQSCNLCFREVGGERGKAVLLDETWKACAVLPLPTHALACTHTRTHTHARMHAMWPSLSCSFPGAFGRFCLGSADTCRLQAFWGCRGHLAMLKEMPPQTAPLSRRVGHNPVFRSGENLSPLFL